MLQHETGIAPSVPDGSRRNQAGNLIASQTYSCIRPAYHTIVGAAILSNLECFPSMLLLVLPVVSYSAVCNFSMLTHLCRLKCIRFRTQLAAAHSRNRATPVGSVARVHSAVLTQSARPPQRTSRPSVPGQASISQRLRAPVVNHSARMSNAKSIVAAAAASVRDPALDAAGMSLLLVLALL